jgi:CDP-paratose 2-epimerase
LLGDGNEVVVFDNLGRPGVELNLAWLRARHGERAHFVRGDVRDFGAIGRAMQGVEVVYHLAGQTAVTSSIADPRDDFEQNVLGTLNVLEAARLGRNDPIVLFSSTNKVYGELARAPVVEEETRHRFRTLEAGVSEDEPLDFYSPYGCSKGAADQYVRDYHRTYGLRTIVFRQSCIYGPRQMGVEDQGWVAWFLIAATLGREITIFGDGKQLRDLLYIDDLIDAFRLAAAGIEHTAGQVYNIGGGPSHTLSIWCEFEPILADILGRPVSSPRFAPARLGDQKVFVCDVQKAGRDFGWEPTVGIEEGIRRLAGWVSEAAASLSSVSAAR